MSCRTDHLTLQSAIVASLFARKHRHQLPAPPRVDPALRDHDRRIRVPSSHADPRLAGLVDLGGEDRLACDSEEPQAHDALLGALLRVVRSRRLEDCAHGDTEPRGGRECKAGSRRWRARRAG
jgi:hypothetical protein